MSWWQIKRPRSHGRVTNKLSLIATSGIRAFPPRTASSQLLRMSTMASTSQGKRVRDDGRSTLDADIQALNHAMDTCGISPAQDAFDSAGALLAAIRVRSMLLRSNELRAHRYAGLHG